MSNTMKEYKLVVDGMFGKWETVGETPDAYGMQRLKQLIVRNIAVTWCSLVGALEAKARLVDDAREFGFNLPVRVVMRVVTDWQTVNK